MRIKILILFLILAAFNKAKAQSFSYSYTDPCTGNIKSISVPANGGIAVSYYGQIKTFSYNEFLNGTFDNWANSTFAQFQTTSPCAEVVGLSTAVTVTQGQTLSVIGILNSLTAIADMASSGASNIVGGAAGAVANTPSGDGGNGSGNNSSSTSTSGSTTPSTTTSGGSSSGSSTTPTTPTNGNNNGSSGTGNSSGSGNSGSSGSGSSSSGGSGGTTSGNKSGEGSSSDNASGGGEESKGETNITAGGTQTVKGGGSSNSGSSKAGKAGGAKEGGKPSIVASGDFVGFNFKNSDTRLGAKASGGYSALRWDGARAHGVMADYTSALKGPNITGYYAWIKPRTTSLISTTATIGFEGYGSQYVTIAIGQMKSFNKIKKFKIVYMATGSFGQVYKEPFIGTALIAGAMYDWKVSKRLDVKLMNLAIYAPYVSYYNDVLLKSPFVMLPSIGTNIGITKRFKFNINAGGAWALGDDALNYTVTMGTRLLL